MNQEQCILNHIQEECAEVAQRASKAMRFGLLETQDGHYSNNLERLEEELVDLLTCVEMLNDYIRDNYKEQSYIFEDEDKVESMTCSKRKKIELYMQISRKRGHLI